MGLSAMLADEYILIVPFAHQLQSGLDEQSGLQNITSTALTLLSSGSG
jgi:hypothetical protein